MIDAREIERYEKCIQEFENAFENLVQANRRFIRIVEQCMNPVQSADIPAKVNITATNIAPINITYQGPNTGEVCRKCGQFAMIRTGTCSTCQNCGESGGCA